jgi:uncharacterized protein YkwD
MGVVRSRTSRWLSVGALLLASLFAVGFVPARVDAGADDLVRASRAGAVPRAEAVARPDLRDDLVALVNQARVTEGLGAVRLDVRLSRYAARHSRRMADLGYLFHSGDEQLRGALDDVAWSFAGENVGAGTDAEALHEAFMDSAPHRRNILRRSFDRIAVGVVEADGALWVTAVFYAS